MSEPMVPVQRMWLQPAAAQARAKVADALLTGAPRYGRLLC